MVYIKKFIYQLIITLLVILQIVIIQVEESAILDLEKINNSLVGQLNIALSSEKDNFEEIEHLKLVIQLMDDGASKKQAEQTIEVAEEAGLDPKFLGL